MSEATRRPPGDDLEDRFWSGVSVGDIRSCWEWKRSCYKTDNLRDMCIKQRGKNQIPAGEKHPRSKLTTEQVKAIRKRHSVGERQIDLAQEFNVRPQTINQIIHRQIWKTV